MGAGTAGKVGVAVVVVEVLVFLAGFVLLDDVAGCWSYS